MSSLENANCAFNEMMVHVPMCTHKEPGKVLVIGNADAQLQEEVAKHKAEAIYGDVAVLNAHNEKDIDVIILTDVAVDDMLLANVERILKDDGLITFASKSFHRNEDVLKADLRKVGEKFWIAMPFSFGHNTSIIASKKYHPTADLVLQVSDLLDNVNYYSTEIHHASFVFASHIHRKLTGIAKR